VDHAARGGWLTAQRLDHEARRFRFHRRYPVLFQVYGGPGSQTVVDGWTGSQYLWHLMLTQKGYIVASVDNRGTGARGRAWRKVIYQQLGVVETQDQASAAADLRSGRGWIPSGSESGAGATVDS
jgi:dipeptidyl aminopeptidase/acylaminoacyl peptidase